MRGRSAHSGFTLIELICAMILLAILVATAIPKYGEMRANAREAVLKAYAGAIKSAVDQVRMKWRVAGGGAYVAMIDGGQVKVNPATGYPTLDADGIGALMQCNGARCDEMRVDYSMVLVLFTPGNARVGRCTVFYWPNDMVVTLDVTNCAG